MRKIQRIVAILFFICLCMAAYSQDVIVTKDSRHIQAEIIDVSPSVIRYKVYGKPNSPIITISTKDVKSVIYESDIEPEEDIEQNKKKEKRNNGERPYISGTTFHAYIESSVSYNKKHSLYSIKPLKVAIGPQFSDYVFIGAGLGTTLFPDNIAEKGYEMFDTTFKEYYDKIPQWHFSAFGITKITYPINEKIVPFLEIEGGYNLCRREWTDEWFGAPYFSTSIGISIYHFDISTGYERYIMPVDRLYKPYKEWTYFDESSRTNGTLPFGNIFIKIGAKIGYLKK